MPSGLYAKTTTVSPERSREELMQVLKRYGATDVGYLEQQVEAGRVRVQVAFRVNGLAVRFQVEQPPLDTLLRTHAGRRRSLAESRRAAQQAYRQRWRALVLAVKARLECVQTGVTTMEQEFIANAVLPSGDTVAEYALSQWHPGAGPLLLGAGAEPTE